MLPTFAQAMSMIGADITVKNEAKNGSLLAEQ
jgi:hypothetical protein